MVNKPFVFQVVGYQNSGKTTTMVKIIEQLARENIVRFVTIKHHGHGGKPDVVEKDSTHHLRAGGLASLVEGDGLLLLQAEQAKWSLEEKIALSSYFKPELILIEGHKYAPYPKLVILRDKDDFHLLEQLSDIRAVLYWDEPCETNKQIPQFFIKEEDWLPWIIQFINKNTKSKN